MYKNEQNFRPDECTLCKCQVDIIALCIKQGSDKLVFLGWYRDLPAVCMSGLGLPSAANTLRAGSLLPEMPRY